EAAGTEGTGGGAGGQGQGQATDRSGQGGGAEQGRPARLGPVPGQPPAGDHGGHQRYAEQQAGEHVGRGGRQAGQDRQGGQRAEVHGDQADGGTGADGEAGTEQVRRRPGGHGRGVQEADQGEAGLPGD